MGIDEIRAINDFPIRDLGDPLFSRYGRILCAYDVQELIELADNTTSIDSEKNTYVASVPTLESSPVVQQICNTIYGGMPVEVGYCNGPNSTINGLEYHKSPEVFIAVTDCIQFLGHTQDIVDNSYYETTLTDVFFFPAGSIVECYASTLHFGPCKTKSEGFKSIIMLPLGTNTPLGTERPNPADPEAHLLFMRNKWLLAHPERTALINNGAFPGLKGPNRKILIP
jgi:hypothetical protein